MWSRQSELVLDLPDCGVGQRNFYATKLSSICKLLTIINRGGQQVGRMAPQYSQYLGLKPLEFKR